MKRDWLIIPLMAAVMISVAALPGCKKKHSREITYTSQSTTIVQSQRVVGDAPSAAPARPAPAAPQPYSQGGAYGNNQQQPNQQTQSPVEVYGDSPAQSPAPQYATPDNYAQDASNYAQDPNQDQGGYDEDQAGAQPAPADPYAAPSYWQPGYAVEPQPPLIAEPQPVIVQPQPVLVQPEPQYVYPAPVAGVVVGGWYAHRPGPVFHHEPDHRDGDSRDGRRGGDRGGRPDGDDRGHTSRGDSDRDRDGDHRRDNGKDDVKPFGLGKPNNVPVTHFVNGKPAGVSSVRYRQPSLDSSSGRTVQNATKPPTVLSTPPQPKPASLSPRTIGPSKAVSTAQPDKPPVIKKSTGSARRDNSDDRSSKSSSQNPDDRRRKN